MRMSRAGRKELMYRALVRHDKRYPRAALPTAKLAHAAGLISSTEVVKMLRELVADGKVIECQTEPTYQCGYTVRAWALARMQQVALPDRVIVINRKSFFYETGEQV